MTPKDVAKRVLEITSITANDEVAHGKEDKLYQDVLRAIAAGECEDPKGCAATALETVDLDFDRWCA